MHSVNSYQDIKTEEDEEYERDVEIAFENLATYAKSKTDCKYYKEIKENDF